MRKPFAFLSPLAMIVVLSAALLSCKDDEPTISGISFELEAQEVPESDGTFASFHPELTQDETQGREIEVKLVLDHALEGDAVIRFDIDGSARENATSRELNDYMILEDGENITVDENELTILKGSKEATIKVLVYEDADFEYDTEMTDEGIPFENLELSLISVVSGPIKLGAQLDHNLRILEDDFVAFLQWAPQDMTAADAKVDMDFLFWVDGQRISPQTIGGAEEGTSGQEVVVIPAGLVEGNMGVSYTYFGGESDDVDFIGAFFSTAGTLNGQHYTFPDGDPLVFEGNYKKINRHDWTVEGAAAPKVAQTMVKSGIDYSSITGISPFPDGGSRVGNRIPLKLDRSLLRKIALEHKQNLNSQKNAGTFKTLKIK